MRRILIAIVVALVGCHAAENQNPCPRGVCAGGGSGGGGSGGGGGGSGGCVESWTCSQWTPDASRTMYTRMCSDANNCGTTANKPPVGPIPLPALDVNYYRCKVEPILDRGCSMMACHGTAATDNTRAFRVFARGRRRNDETAQPMCLETMAVNLDVAGSGTTMCHGWTAHTNAEWQKNYDSSRALLVGLSDPDQSDLLAQPVVGGKAHTGVHVFASKTDPDYVTIRSWLTGATLGSCDPMN
jgi:hypothetical protein